MNWWVVIMNDYEIIKEATETYEKNLNAGCYVGDLLNIIKRQNAEINRLKGIIANVQTSIEEIIKMNGT